MVELNNDTYNNDAALRRLRWQALLELRNHGGYHTTLVGHDADLGEFFDDYEKAGPLSADEVVLGPHAAHLEEEHVRPNACVYDFPLRGAGVVHDEAVGL
ncbi:MAG TPA: hypothetical protein VHD60_04215 [Candidatus Saccharimonadales bacterium]|nr:hypothetical protein [Candidatus Saccharimonadales bacterium]